MHYCGTHEFLETCIFFVNGIMNNLRDAYESASRLSEMASEHCIRFIHNKSLGFVGSDAVRAFFGLYFSYDSKAVRDLRSEWDKVLADNPFLTILHFCHSEGAIVTRNALIDYHLKGQIIVVAIAPAAYIDDDKMKGVYHYRSTRDIVPLLDLWGAWKCRHTTTVLKPHKDAPWFDHSFNSPTYKRTQQMHINNYKNTYLGQS